MHIARLEVENFKRIVAVDITPDDHMVVISGANDQGKSSVLDSIYAAFKSREIKKTTPQPVRHGEEKCVIKVDVREYIVTRTFSANGTNKLKVETPAGEQVRNPQAVLDDLVGALSLDPLRFISAKGDDQVKQLTAAFEINLSEFEAIDKQHRADRLLEKRHKDTLKAQIEGLAPPTDSDPTEERSISDLMSDFDTAKQAADREKQRKERVSCIIKEMESLRQELEDLKKQEPDHDLQDIADKLQKAAENAEQNNRRAREVQEYNRLREQIASAETTIQDFSDRIELNDIKKLEALESISLPVSGLNIEPDGLLFDDIPFSQLSQSKQIQIAMAVVMAASPKLKVIRITQGSLIDEKNMKIIEEMAIKEGFQVWIEMVDTSGTVGICIEEGEIKNGDAGCLEPD